MGEEPEWPHVPSLPPAGGLGPWTLALKALSAHFFSDYLTLEKAREQAVFLTDFPSTPPSSVEVHRSAVVMSACWCSSPSLPARVAMTSVPAGPV